MDKDYNSPEWEGLPSFNQHNTGFCVKLLDKSNHTWLGHDKWNTIMNSYGHSWTYKGFAINCARAWLRRWRSEGIYACVVDMANDNVVWSSWRDYKKPT
jgi:hypothetical protein